METKIQKPADAPLKRSTTQKLVNALLKEFTDCLDKAEKLEQAGVPVYDLLLKILVKIISEKSSSAAESAIVTSCGPNPNVPRFTSTAIQTESFTAAWTERRLPIFTEPKASESLAAVTKKSSDAPNKFLKESFRNEVQRKLWTAVKRNNRLEIEEAVHSGADIEERRVDGKTPLVLAARDGLEEAVSELIQLGADIGVKAGWRQWTPLHWATAKGREGCVALLLAAGAEPGPEDGARQTPLHYAAANGHLHVARLLVDGGAELNAPASWGGTPLAMAKMFDFPDLQSYLRSVGGRE